MLRPKLSLAMIVKDEEGNLANCLRSVVGHVDEVIIVDTGSRDRTREVAVSYGASVIQYDHLNHPESFFTDNEETCKQFTAPGPYSGDIALGDFGAARAESFKHVTGDYVLWLDADDQLENAAELRACVDRMVQGNTDMVFLPYNYARDHLGRVFYRQWRERLMRRGVANWTNPVHEVLLPVRPVSHFRSEQPCVAHHRKSDRRSIPHRNYKILLRQLYQQTGGKIDDPRLDPRTLFYLGQEARYIDQQRAAEFYREYLTRSGWNEERAAAHGSLGQMYEFGMLPVSQKEGYALADQHYAAAASEMPDNPDGLLGLARIAYLRGRWIDCINYTERAFKIDNTESMLGANPMDRLYRPHIYLNHALAHLGRFEEALASCKAGLAVCPDDPGVPMGASGMLSFNLRVYQDRLNPPAQPAALPEPPPGHRPVATVDKNENLETPPSPEIPPDAVTIWSMQIWKQLVHVERDWMRATALLGALPESTRRDPVFQKMLSSTAQKPADWWRRQYDPNATLLPLNLDLSRALKLSVAVWIGPAFEPWDPTTPETKGIGGSETACIEMCRELVQLGHSVTVYGHCPTSEGNYDGVRYRHWERLGQEFIDCDVFISSRAPAIMEAHDRVRAKLRLLWVHDIHVGSPNPQMERWLHRFDRVLCLSQWHRAFFLQTYPWLAPSKVLVTRNGINPARFSAAPPKTNRLIFSSSPNRGLDTLLLNFPFVRQHVPDAELHIYYGFDVWEAFARPRNDPNELADIARYKSLIEQSMRAGGVFHHGRVSQSVLADAFLRSKFWSYPTSFTETSCISAMEAQAAGAVPVTTRLAALGETVKHGVLIDPSPDYGRQWVEMVVRCLRDEQFRRPLDVGGRKYALENLSWAALARDWSAMFDRLVAEVAARPVPVWKEA